MRLNPKPPTLSKQAQDDIQKVVHDTGGGGASDSGQGGPDVDHSPTNTALGPAMAPLVVKDQNTSNARSLRQLADGLQ